MDRQESAYPQSSEISMSKLRQMRELPIGWLYTSDLGLRSHSSEFIHRACFLRHSHQQTVTARFNCMQP